MMFTRKPGAPSLAPALTPPAASATPLPRPFRAPGPPSQPAAWRDRTWADGTWRSVAMPLAMAAVFAVLGHLAVMRDVWPVHGTAARAGVLLRIDLLAGLVWLGVLAVLARSRYRGSRRIVVLPFVLSLVTQATSFHLFGDPVYVPDPGVARTVASEYKSQHARRAAVERDYTPERRRLVGIDAAAPTPRRDGWSRVPRAAGFLAPVLAPIGLLIGFLLGTRELPMRVVRRHRRAALAVVAGAVVVLSIAFTHGGRVGNRTPWEFFLVAFVVLWAAALADDAHNLGAPSVRRPQVLARLIAYGAVPVTPFVLLPGTRDLGIAVVLASSLAAMLVVGTRRRRWLAFMGAVWAVLVVVAFRFDARSATRFALAYEPYRDVATLGGPDAPAARRWAAKVHQTKLFDANVLAGGVLGAGPGRGHPETAPNAADDGFVTSFAAEWGVLGTGALALLYVLFLTSMLAAAAEERGTFERSLVVGLTMLIGMPFWLSALGALRVVPLTGVAAAFIAHGGSKLVASSVAVGVVAAMSHRRRGLHGRTVRDDTRATNPPWLPITETTR